MNEFELIARLTPGLPVNPSVIAGAGDDCAVLEVGLPDQWLLFKTDAVVEGVHFARGVAPQRVGHKALGRCLSDIAAMGGWPSSALITLGLPEDYAVDFVDGLYEGINKLASRQQVAIVGGETTASPGGVFISVAVLGLVTKARCALRSGAKAGDAIFVTGELGGSLLGKHLDFEPRLAEGRWLVETFQVHAMIDLSDGLAGDLRHVLEASQVGAELLSEAIPISRAARQPCRQRPAAEQEQNAPPPSGGATPKSPLLAALTDGEDFELLFTLSSGDAVPLVDAWKQRFPGTRLSCVGRVTSEPGVHIRDRQGPQPLNTDGYVHFAQRGRDR